MIDTGSLNTTTDDSLAASGEGAASGPGRETAIVSPTAPRRRAFRLMPPLRGDRSSEDEEDAGGVGREIQVLRQVREEST